MFSFWLFANLGFVTRENTPLFLSRQSTTYGYISYELKRLVSDIVVVLDDLHVIKAHYLGYSMGGWIGFGMAKYASTRLDSLIIGGAQPYGNSFVHVRETLSNGIEAWVAIVERLSLIHI